MPLPKPDGTPRTESAMPLAAARWSVAAGAAAQPNTSIISAAAAHHRMRLTVSPGQHPLGWTKQIFFPMLGLHKRFLYQKSTSLR
jgi:hypothetical protein